MAQLVKNLPTMRETWVWSRGWEDPLEKGMATHSNILAWRIPWTAVYEVAESNLTERLSLHSMGGVTASVPSSLLSCTPSAISPRRGLYGAHQRKLERFPCCCRYGGKKGWNVEGR